MFKRGMLCHGGIRGSCCHHGGRCRMIFLICWENILTLKVRTRRGTSLEIRYGHFRRLDFCDIIPQDEQSVIFEAKDEFVHVRCQTGLGRTNQASRIVDIQATESDCTKRQYTCTYRYCRACGQRCRNDVECCRFQDFLVCVGAVSHAVNSDQYQPTNQRWVACRC